MCLHVHYFYDRLTMLKHGLTSKIAEYTVSNMSHVYFLLANGSGSKGSGPGGGNCK